MSEAARALLDTYDGEIVIVDGGHRTTTVPGNIKHLLNANRSLDGKPA